ncbi:hypothetical protein [Phaffia rhodozyma]|uniref:Uncharacterized protein n=1 Tax=Phaffia rhodozyma TaxID=264483 RepID=A0A0F7STL2_PHARH|nr:hypothetical protein [Phaffia rhodozyma]
MNDQDHKSEPRITSFLSEFKFTFPPWPKPAGLLSFEEFKSVGHQASAGIEETKASEDEGSSEHHLDGLESIIPDLSIRKDQKLSSAEDREVYRATILQVKDIFGGNGIHGKEPDDTISYDFGPYDSQNDPAVRLYRATREWEISRNQILIDDQAYLIVWAHWKHFAQTERTTTDNQSSDDGRDDDVVLIDEEGNISQFNDGLDGGDVVDDVVKCRFLDDIEGTVKLFLSSRFNPDLVNILWSDERLAAAPKIILSFLKYIVAHKVLPEVHYQSQIQETICFLAAELDSSDSFQAGSDSNNSLKYEKLLPLHHQKEVAAGWGYDSETEE